MITSIFYDGKSIIGNLSISLGFIDLESLSKSRYKINFLGLSLFVFFGIWVNLFDWWVDDNIDYELLICSYLIGSFIGFS